MGGRATLRVRSNCCTGTKPRLRRSGEIPHVAGARSAAITEHRRNHLLATLPPDHAERLLAACESVELPLHHALVEAHLPTRHVYFLTGGLASVVVTSDNREEQLETGHIGFEGMTGFHVLLGRDRTPMSTFIQVPGAGWRLPAASLRAMIEADEVLRTHLLRYVHTFQVQLAYSVLANSRNTIPERLARWLLMCHDRLGVDTLPLTHEFLALMLGVRRSGVTDQIHVLEGAQAIRAKRGRIEVRDRAKLERWAGAGYGDPEDHYESIFGRFRTAERNRTHSLAGKRILIVEDDFDLAMQTKGYLSAQGVEVIGPAPSVQEALRLLLATQNVDAAIVDVNLRGEMAFPLADALRKRDVPFIFVSGYGQKLIPSHLADVEFYNKPIEPSEMAAALLVVA